MHIPHSYLRTERSGMCIEINATSLLQTSRGIVALRRAASERNVRQDRVDFQMAGTHGS